jgi:carbamoyl-phosphate synthase large subunit
MNPVVVMVTGIGGGGNGEQILKALKMASTPYVIVGGDMNPLSKGLSEVDYPYILPPASSPDYITALLRVCKKHGVQALFHGSEPELKVFNTYREVIENEGIFLPINPSNVIELCMDKYKTYQWLKDNGFPVPKTIMISSEKELDEVNLWPCVLKPYVGGGGSNNLFIAQNRMELLNIGKYLLDNLGPFIVQEYVGNTESEYTVGVLSDMHGNLLNSIAVNRMILSGLSSRIKVKNKTGLDQYGEYLAISSGVSQGKIGKFPLVTKTCEEIAMKMGSRGPINVQCRVYGGKVFVFEINPRFSGTTSLRAMVGYNEPDILIRKHVLGEVIEPRFEYRTCDIVRGLCESIIDREGITNA